MEHLFDKLKENGDSDIYPYHMPGHKRHACGALPEAMYLRDITEIDGFDNLHQSEGILLALQRKAAALYGADESFYLVNGSTGGILSAVSAVLPAGGRLLMARNCHKSAYHAAYLRNLEVSYICPELLAGYGIFDAVTPAQVRAALERNPETGAVLLVSPTYEGRISDIREIAGIVHERGIPLIVDEAHGAHLGWADGFAPNSCQAGADIVIHSVHKTLPSLTQTALLHVNGNLTDRERLRRFLHIYQSSSPSYLLMAGIDNALEYLEKEGKRLFAGFLKAWDRMLKRLSACRRLQFLTGDFRSQDIGKLVISTKRAGVSGRWLYDELRQRYHLQPEMSAETYVLAMFTVNDTEEGYERLTQALLETDGRLCGRRDAPEGEADAEKLQALPHCDETQEKLPAFAGCGGAVGEQALPLARAWDMESRPERLSESVGRLSGEFVNLYPPGVPVLAPGEPVTEALCESIRRWCAQGLTVQGIEVKGQEIYIRVLSGDDLTEQK